MTTFFDFVCAFCTTSFNRTAISSADFFERSLVSASITITSVSSISSVALSIASKSGAHIFRVGTFSLLRMVSFTSLHKESWRITTRSRSPNSLPSSECRSALSTFLLFNANAKFCSRLVLDAFNSSSCLARSSFVALQLCSSVNVCEYFVIVSFTFSSRFTFVVETDCSRSLRYLMSFSLCMRALSAFVSQFSTWLLSSDIVLERCTFIWNSSLESASFSFTSSCSFWFASLNVSILCASCSFVSRDLVSCSLRSFIAASLSFL